MSAKSKAKSDMPAPPPAKRRRPNKKDDKSQPKQPKQQSQGRGSVIGVTRSISACQRCRSRKTRCDQKFPSCTGCLKAGVECVGIDAATGREIPRSYVSHLEDRVAFLESKLQTNGIDYDEQAQKDSETAASKNPKKREEAAAPGGSTAAPASKLGNLMTAVKMVNDRPPRQKLGTFLGQSSGLSFARILFTAIKQQQQRHSIASNRASTSTQGGATAPSSSTGTGNANNSTTTENQKPPVAPEPEKPKVKPARLPTKEVAESLLSAYFSQANAQIPILHREEFLHNYFEPIYGKLSTKVSLASDYSTIAADLSDEKDTDCYYYKYCYKFPEPENNDESTLGAPNPCLFFLNMVFGIATSIHQQQYPSHISESYKMAAAHHFDAVFASSNRLESLQGLLLLGLYSIMRPATPGVWYVLGSALRLCIDLGLHYEGGLKSWSNHHNNHGSEHHVNGGGMEFDPTTLDMRRRLFWCTYTLDRQVCVYLGRPFGIGDESIKVPFPSELDDALINRKTHSQIADFSKESSTSPSYKSVSLSFFRIRQIQSEIQRVLYDCAELPRKFKTMSEWKQSMARKLEDWHDQCPKSNRKMNCNFNLAFFELNYHQTRLLLYGLSPGNIQPTVESYLIIADAGEKVIKKYHELHRKRNINYTWVAVHNLFMAGTSYLYALYHSPEVRAGTSLEEIDFNTLACIHVLSSMTDRCDAAAGCRDSFELLTAAIMKLCYNEKAGIVMTLNKPDSTNPTPAVSSAPTPNAENTPFNVAVARRQSVKQELKDADEVDGIEPPPASSEMTWPMPDDLEMFFQEAAQLEGISPDSMRTSGNGAGASQSPETTSTPWGYSNPGSEHEGSDAMVIEQDRASQQQHHHHPGHGHHSHHQHQRNDQQRIYDLMNEVPLAPIWDQFFAPGGNGPHNSMTNASGQSNQNTPMSDMMGNGRWP